MRYDKAAFRSGLNQFLEFYRTFVIQTCFRMGVSYSQRYGFRGGPGFRRFLFTRGPDKGKACGEKNKNDKNFLHVRLSFEKRYNNVDYIKQLLCQNKCSKVKSLFE
jgi:hypothetical protein